MEIAQTRTGTWRWCMNMFGARFAVFVRRARVLPSPLYATRNLSFLRFHRRRHPVVSSCCFTWTGTGWCENSTRWKLCKREQTRGGGAWACLAHGLQWFRNVRAFSPVRCMDTCTTIHLSDEPATHTKSQSQTFSAAFNSSTAVPGKRQGKRLSVTFTHETNSPPQDYPLQPFVLADH